MEQEELSLNNRRADMGPTRKPGKESNKATLARIEKEMAQPRIVKSARKGASTRQDSQSPRHDRLSPQLLFRKLAFEPPFDRFTT